MERIGEIRDPVLRAVCALTDQVLEPLAWELVTLEWAQEGGRQILRMFIDRKDGNLVKFEDCSEVSRILDPLLEGEEPVPFPFTLEVSSPGLDRPLARRQDMEEAMGKIAYVETYEPVDGRRRFRGHLSELRRQDLSMEVDGKTYSVPLNLIRRATLDYFASADEAKQTKKAGRKGATPAVNETDFKNQSKRGTEHVR